MRLLRLLSLALSLTLLALLAAPTIMLLKGLQSEPLVAPTTSARQEDVGRLKALLKAHDPRELKDGETRTVTVSERDLNLALRVALPRSGRQHARVNLEQRQVTLRYTLHLPQNPLGRYLNITLLLAENSGQPTLERAQLGEIDLPGWTLAPFLALAENTLTTRFPEYQGARQALRKIALEPGTASFTYRWDRALAKQIEQRGREVFLPPEDRERALAYYRVLATVSHRLGNSASLNRLLQPLFSQAVLRSSEGDHAAENRALLLVLGTVLNRSSMHRLVGGNPADLLPSHRYVRWTLHSRADLAQHFGISAAIAAAGGGALADAIGVFKELDDSRGGSGFSFADLLADRAGVELSTALTGPRARRIQETMARDSLAEADFMPPVDALPEGLMELEFKQRYRDLDDARYAYVKDEIDGRIANLPIYR